MNCSETGIGFLLKMNDRFQFSFRKEINLVGLNNMFKIVLIFALETSRVILKRYCYAKT